MPLCKDIILEKPEELESNSGTSDQYTSKQLADSSTTPVNRALGGTTLWTQDILDPTDKWHNISIHTKKQFQAFTPEELFGKGDSVHKHAHCSKAMIENLASPSPAEESGNYYSWMHLIHRSCSK